MSDSKTTPPTKAEIREGARDLMRSCLARFGQEVDEEVVKRQAEKIVRHLWPTIKRAWAGGIMNERAPQMTPRLAAAIRVGCAAANVHLTCSYPDCACKQIPAAVRAAVRMLAADVARLPDEIRKKMAHT